MYLHFPSPYQGEGRGEVFPPPDKGGGEGIAVQNPTNPLKTLTRIKIGGAESGS